MKASNFFIATLRNNPAEAEVVSHRLMLRSGMIRQLATGVYTWLPLGLRVLRKVEAIVREEMDQIGAQEIVMPGIQPAELWQKSQRWDEYGPMLLRLTDRNGHAFCLGPTHEEMITDLARREIHSYKQLPVCFYQIQVKFRDEIRPRFGVLRAREFLMKDAYSFHLTEVSLQETYNLMFEAYSRIFSRLDLNYRAVLAENSTIGGSISHEFHVLAQAGEDQIAYSNNGHYAANIERAESIRSTQLRPAPSQTMQMLATPGQHSIEAVSSHLNIDPSRCLKTLIVQDKNGVLAALIVRGDHTLNIIKAQRLQQLTGPIQLADAATIRQQLDCEPGTIGPIGLNIPIIADYDALNTADFVCGANRDDQHFIGVNWVRDVPEPIAADIRNVQEGEMSIDNSGELKIAKGIEVGHIFQLGEKYSAAIQATCLNKQGKKKLLQMGCYGIGVSRIVAAAIEQNHDDCGIIWPAPIAPFCLALIPINMYRSKQLHDAIMALYQQFLDAGIDVLLDDRNERPGVMFSDMELIGIPHCFILNEKRLARNEIEYRARADQKQRVIALDTAFSFFKERLTLGQVTQVA